MRALICIALLFSASVFGQTINQSFYGAKQEGWFFYKDPKEIKRKDTVIPKPIGPPQSEKEAEKDAHNPDRIPAFSVKWLRANLDKLRDVALDDPSPENVQAYYYAQRVMLDKADRFATVSQQVVLSDPYLDENNNFPFATAARANVLRLQQDAKKAGLKHLAEKAGIWFFFDSKCSFCALQVGVVKHLANDYGFLVKAITLDGKTLPGLDIPVVRDQGQFRNLNLSMTPTIVLAVPPKTFLVISQGVLSDESADDRILSAAATQKLLPAEMNKEIDIFSKGILTAEDLNAEEAKRIGDDPKKWVDYLQGKLKSKY